VTAQIRARLDIEIRGQRNHWPVSRPNTSSRIRSDRQADLRPNRPCLWPATLDLGGRLATEPSYPLASATSPPLVENLAREQEGAIMLTATIYFIAVGLTAAPEDHFKPDPKPGRK